MIDRQRIFMYVIYLHAYNLKPIEQLKPDKMCDFYSACKKYISLRGV